MLARLGGAGLALYGLPWLAGCPGGSTWGREESHGAAAGEGSASPPGQHRMAVPADGAVEVWRVGNATGYVLQDAGGQWVAMSRVCTHSRCKVNHRAEQGDFECPCHHSIFDLEGNVLKGPAKRPLPKYPVSLEGGELVIDLSGMSAADMAKPERGAAGAAGGGVAQSDDAQDEDGHRGRGRGRGGRDSDDDDEHEDDDSGSAETPGWNP
ncbi:Rieske (2Fe-2S) protein [bacterium]|nr:Rieske (2Fe-2S) protein [bacterium]